MNRRLLAVALVLLVAAAVALEAVRDARYGEPQPAESVLYIRSAAFLQRASLSNTSLLADVYWIRAIQYYGGTRRAKDVQKRYDLLYPLLDIVTSLDPRFTIAYRFGSVFLAERYPGGAGRPDLAIRLLEKGRAADPLKWQYDFDLGFVYYWFLQDFDRAAEAFNRGALVKDAPWWMRSMAAIIKGTSGDRRGARMLWQQIRDTAETDWVRTNADLRLAQLDALDQIDQLQRMVSEFVRRTGQRPGSWDALVRIGWLRGVPLDPSGVPYALEPAAGRVTVSTESKMYPLPTDPGAWVHQPRQ